MKKRILAMLLACMMLVTIFPLSVFADNTAEAEHDHAAHAATCPGEGNKHTKDNCDYEQVGEPIPSRCGEYGYTLYKCTECGVQFAADFTPPEAGDHAWEIVKEAKDATCTADGCTEGKVCSICGAEVQSNVISKLDHEYEEISRVGNCLTSGMITYKCKTCDSTYTEDIEGTGEGHAWSDIPTIKTEPTWNTDGVAVYTCTVCGETKDVRIVADHDHELTKHEALAPTCATKGNSEYWTCDICGAYYADEAATTNTTATKVVIAALGHDYSVVVKDDTGLIACDSTVNGEKITKCSRCDSQKTEVVYPNKHTFDPNPVHLDPTCTQWGYDFYHCLNCGALDTENSVSIAPLGHTAYAEGKNQETNQATCETAGSKTWDCGRCGEHMSEEIPANTHSPKTHTVNATCSSTGYTFTYCTNENCNLDDATEVEYSGVVYDVKVDGDSVKLIAFGEILAIAPNAHDMQWTVLNEATCTEDGDKMGYCMRCSFVDDYVVIEAKGHTATGSWITTAATCESAGYRYKKCANCDGKAVEETIAATGHNWKAGTAVAPTCSESGYTPYTCSNCKSVEKRNTVEFEGVSGWYETFEDALADHIHLSEDSRQIARKGDCLTVGLYYYPCTDCGKNIAVRIVGTGEHHDDGVYDQSGELAAKAATCTEDGHTEAYVCTKCGVLIESTVIPKKGHTVVADKAVAATCTASGKTAGSHCSVCSAVIVAQKEIPAKGHTEVIRPAVAATCTTSGKTEGKYCSVCNITLVTQSTIPAIEHKNGMTVVDSREVGCETFGYTHWACKLCKSTTTLDFTYEYIDGYKAGYAHVFAADADRSYDAKCESTGLIAKTCTNPNCDAHDDTVTAALGHKNAAGVVLIDSCTNNVDDRECKACGEEIGNTHENFTTVDIDATCKDYGYTLDYCTTCEYQRVYDVDDTYLSEHTWGEWKSVVDATITEGGSDSRTCSICGATEQRDTEPLVGLEFNMSNANAVRGDEYADSSLMAVTVSVTGNENGVDAWGMQFNVNYDNKVLEFVRAEFVSNSFKLAMANDVGDYVTVIASTENDMNGQTNATVTEAENVVVLYFRVAIGDETYKAQNTSLYFSDIEIVDKDSNEIIGVGNDMQVGIRKFMDINGDGSVSLADVQIVGSMITSTTDYDVTVDVNKDGVINLVDFMAIREYLIFAKSYEDMTNLGVSA